MFNFSLSSKLQASTEQCLTAAWTRRGDEGGGEYYQALIFAVGSFLDCLLKLTVKANWLQNSGQEPENASLCDSGKLILTKEIPVNTAIDWEK